MIPPNLRPEIQAEYRLWYGDWHYRAIIPSTICATVEKAWFSSDNQVVRLEHTASTGFGSTWRYEGTDNEGLVLMMADFLFRPYFELCVLTRNLTDGCLRLLKSGYYTLDRWTLAKKWDE